MGGTGLGEMVKCPCHAWNGDSPQVQRGNDNTEFRFCKFTFDLHTAELLAAFYVFFSIFLRAGETLFYQCLSLNSKLV